MGKVIRPAGRGGTAVGVKKALPWNPKNSGFRLLRRSQVLSGLSRSVRWRTHECAVLMYNRDVGSGKEKPSGESLGVLSLFVAVWRRDYHYRRFTIRFIVWNRHPSTESFFIAVTFVVFIFSNVALLRLGHSDSPKMWSA